MHHRNKYRRSQQQQRMTKLFKLSLGQLSISLELIDKAIVRQITRLSSMEMVNKGDVGIVRDV